MGCWWILPKQAIPKPQTPYPHFDPLHWRWRELLRGFTPTAAPPRLNSNVPTQKYILCSSLVSGLSVSVLPRSCPAIGDETYCTGLPDKRGDNHHLPVWTEKTLTGPRMGWGEGGGVHREVSVSWATTLIVCPCLKFPITLHQVRRLTFSPLHWFLISLPSASGFYMEGSDWTWGDDVKKQEEEKRFHCPLSGRLNNTIVSFSWYLLDVILKKTGTEDVY